MLSELERRLRLPFSVKGNSGRGRRRDYRYKNYAFQQQLHWNHEYGVHSVDALLAHENYANTVNELYVTKNIEIEPGLNNLINFAEPVTSQDYSETYRTESYLGRVRYGYDSRYNIEFSFRRDGSSRFSKKSRWGNFWSTGANWVITNEKWMKKYDWVNYLKLRASVGNPGNQNYVDTEAFGLHAERVGERFYGIFGGVIPTAEERHETTAHAAGVDDATAVLLPHVRQHLLRQTCQTEHVHFKLTLGFLDAHVLDSAVRAVAGIVDEHVDATFFGDEFLECGVDTLSIGHVHFQRCHTVLLEVFHLVHATRCAVHFVSLLCEFDGGLIAHAATRSGQ